LPRSKLAETVALACWGTVLVTATAFAFMLAGVGGLAALLITVLSGWLQIVAGVATVVSAAPVRPLPRTSLAIGAFALASGAALQFTVREFVANL
jgi:hypothetical protein